MKQKHWWVALACAALLFSIAGCQSSNKTGEGGGTTQLIGAGSTFVYPIMTRWVSDFQQKNPGVQINYQSIGSGGGIQQLSKGLVQFAASDMALNSEKQADLGGIYQLAESAGPVCITYNLPELKEPLKLSAASLSGIYLGTIKSWQDPHIKKDNPGVNLPKTDIAVVHRSDGSGTTNIFTTYLAAVSPEWKSKVGQGLSVSWPVGIGGKGSEGVTGVVKQTPGAIGYVELTYATTNNLPVAVVENQAKQYIKPSAESTTAAIDAFSSELAKDITTPIVNPPATAKEAYPISGLTFLLIPKNPGDQAKRQALKNFVGYILQNGQSIAPNLNYAPLPQSLVQSEMSIVNQM